MAVARPAQVRSNRPLREFFKPVSIPFWGVHLTALVGIAITGWSWTGLLLAVGLYYARMFFVTGAYHRYFSHRTYKTSRWFQFVLGVGATSASQKSPLWWAAHHRSHHRYSDQEGDIHSAKRDGLWWSHVGWIIAREHEDTDLDAVRDLAKYPEMMWLHRFWWITPIALAVGLFLVGGWHALLWGFFVSTALLWHGTFTINSLSHMFGSRRYQTTDDSRNNWFLAIVTMGEGWHNNHHHYMGSANQGFKWWEIDLTYYILRGLAAVGLIWDVRKAPAHIVAGEHRTPRKRGRTLPVAVEVEVEELPVLERAA
jgi:stearoyl-CoA desaturase (Delta-9 desaturase)